MGGGTMNTLKAFQRPPMQVRVSDPALTDFIAQLAAHAPAVETALRLRRRGLLASLPREQRTGLRCQLAQLRDTIADALAELERPATDPLPPTPKPVTETDITK